MNVRIAGTSSGICARMPWSAHRIELPVGSPTWTLFLTGPVVRKWGFHCINGWRQATTVSGASRKICQ
jgi:hypothetical protein